MIHSVETTLVTLFLRVPDVCKFVIKLMQTTNGVNNRRKFSNKILSSFWKIAVFKLMFIKKSLHVADYKGRRYNVIELVSSDQVSQLGASHTLPTLCRVQLKRTHINTAISGKQLNIYPPCVSLEGY